MNEFQDPQKSEYLNIIPKEKLEMISEKISYALTQVDKLEHFDVDEVIAPFKGHGPYELNYVNIEISEEMYKRSAVRNRDSSRMLALVSKLLDLTFDGRKKDLQRN